MATRANKSNQRNMGTRPALPPDEDARWRAHRRTLDSAVRDLAARMSKVERSLSALNSRALGDLALELRSIEKLLSDTGKLSVILQDQHQDFYNSAGAVRGLNIRFRAALDGTPAQVQPRPHPVPFTATKRPPVRPAEVQHGPKSQDFYDNPLSGK